MSFEKYLINDKTIFYFLLQFVRLLYTGTEFIPLWPTGKKPNFNGKTVTDSIYNERIWRCYPGHVHICCAAV
jgi:hypothetical protein